MKHFLASTSLVALATLPSLATAQGVTDLGLLIVTATAEPTEEDRIGTSVEVITEEQLQDTSGALATDVLQRAPGITVNRNGPIGGNADLRIRGAQEQFTAVYVDGIKVNDPSTTSGQFGNFGGLTTGGITRIEVLKGAQSALYGGSAVAGVVNIFTLPIENAPEGTSQRADFLFGSYNTLSLDYGLTQRTGPLTLSFGLSHLRSDGFSAADENDGNTEKDGVRTTRLSFGARYEANDMVTLGVNGFVEDSDSDFDEFGPSDGTPGDEDAFRRARALRAYAEIDTGVWSHSTALSYFDLDRGLSSASAFFGFDSRFKADRVRFEHVSSVEVNEGLRLSFGLDAEEETARYANLPGGSQSTTTRGAFIEAQFAPTADLDIVATLRADDHSTFGSEITGRAALSWRAAQGVRLRAAASTGYRAPTIDELYGDYPGAFPYFGNAALTPETSESFELGASFDLNNGGTVDLTLFRNDIDNLVRFVPCPAVDTNSDGFVDQCDAGTFSTLENVVGRSRLQGVELGAAFPVSDAITVTGAYTYTDAKDPSGAQLIRVPEHALHLGLTAQLTDRLRGQFDLRRETGRAPEGFANIQPDNFTTVDATFTYEVNDSTEAYLRIENLLDEEYQVVPGFGTSDRAAYFGIRASF